VSVRSGRMSVRSAGPAWSARSPVGSARSPVWSARSPVWSVRSRVCARLLRRVARAWGGRPAYPVRFDPLVPDGEMAIGVTSDLAGRPYPSHVAWCSLRSVRAVLAGAGSSPVPCRSLSVCFRFVAGPFRFAASPCWSLLVPAGPPGRRSATPNGSVADPGSPTPISDAVPPIQPGLRPCASCSCA
jgi:hypothetical protein